MRVSHQIDPLKCFNYSLNTGHFVYLAIYCKIVDTFNLNTRNKTHITVAARVTCSMQK